MKKILMMILITHCLGIFSQARAQSVEVQQLLLDVTKLAQFKEILKDLENSYEILHKGYSRIKSIAAGNFSLHEAFIDGLLMVNPSVAGYRRVADIIHDETLLVAQYKTAFNYFKSAGWFRSAELAYVGRVYANLVDKSVDNLDALATVLTSGKLRMTDGERLDAVDRLYRDTHRMLGFLLDFNDKVATLGRQRQMQQADRELLKKMKGFN